MGEIRIVGPGKMQISLSDEQEMLFQYNAHSVQQQDQELP